MSEYDGYFLYHSIGQYPGKQEQLTKALSEFSEKWSASGDAQWHYAEAIEADYLSKWARLLNAPTGSVAHAETVTAAVHALITALPHTSLHGKRVVISADSFPSLLFLFDGLAKRYGFTLDIVPVREGQYWVECDDIASRIDDTVGLVMLNWISSTSSHKCNVARLTELSHAAGALVGIDITQGAGILPFDVTDVPVDFAATTSLKWIGGVPGAGVLYVQPELTALCKPERRGWFSQADPFNWSFDEFAFANDARKFNLGTPAALGFVGTVSALDWILDGGMQASRAVNLSCTKKILQMIDELKLTLVSPAEETGRGASVMIKLPARVSASDSLTSLKIEGIFADSRGDVLRLSAGILTSEGSVSSLRDCLYKICFA